MNAPHKDAEAVALREVTLNDKYTLPSGRVYLNGTQALVRLPMMQRARDENSVVVAQIEPFYDPLVDGDA